MKIISLVPSQSELLWYLGLREELAGITKFCIHPQEMFRTVTRIGGTKTVNIEKIKEINPDLVIANKEENEKEQIEALQAGFRVLVTDIYTLDDALDMIREVGALVGRAEKANELAENIGKNFDALTIPAKRKKAIYLIWKNPYMAAGKNTFIDDMLYHAGFENIMTTERYPELSMEDIQQLNPEVVLLSSEPFPFKDIHLNEFKTHGLNARIVDGEMFSWYGSRLLHAPAYFNGLGKEAT